MKNKTIALVVLLLIMIAAIAGTAGYMLANRKYSKVVRNDQSDAQPEADNDENDTSDETYKKDKFDGSVLYNGERYEVNTAIDTVLFLGIDSSNQKREGVGIVEGGRSDTIILFIIDNEKEMITPLEISRDTMVDVDIYDNDGNFISQGTEQITMQYSYGDNPRKASNLTKEKISDLLCRTRIDSVVSLTMDGIEPIVNAIGGITLKLTTDETDLNPEYKEGAVIQLNGAAAKDFVHTRDIKTRGSNNDRMSRQTQFMIALFQNIRGKGNSIIGIMEDAAGDYLYEDLDADSMAHFTRYDYSGEVLTLPGENVIGNLHDEFYVDENKLTEMVLKLFYKKT